MDWFRRSGAGSEEGSADMLCQHLRVLVSLQKRLGPGARHQSAGRREARPEASDAPASSTGRRAPILLPFEERP
jgi:hypothetical protein